MADSLAENLDKAYAATQQPGPTPAPAVGPRLNTQGWFGRAKDYLANTDWGNLAEAMYRVNPITAPLTFGYDALTKGVPTAIANQRLVAGQLSRFPTDVAASVTGLYPGIAAIRSAATGEPMSDFANTMLGVTESIDKFGRENWAESIAGRSLAGDDAGSLLRGTTPEMAGQWARLMSQAIVPLPTKVTAPIMAGAAAIKEGLGVLGPAAAVAAKTIEAITPLAVSTAPSTKNMLINLGVQGTVGPIAEATMQSLLPAQEAKKTQDEADKVIQQGTAQATAGKDVALGEKIVPPATPQNAGFITGDTGTDIGITTAIVLGGLFAARRNETVRRVTDGVTRAVFDRESLTGYSKTKIEDATVQGLTTKLKQQYSDRSASLPASLEETLRSSGRFSEQRIADMVGRYKEDMASRSGAGLSTKERVFYDTGEYMDTPIKSKPMNDLAVEFGAATPAQQKAAAELLWARQEVDIRQRMMQKQFQTGTGPLATTPVGSPLADAALLAAERAAGRTPTGTGIFQNKYSYNLHGMSTKQLHDLINVHSADPVVRNLVRGYRDIVDKAGQYMAVEKRMTAAQARKFRNENPNYVPPQLGKNSNFIDPRDPVANFNPRTGTDIPKGLEKFEELGNPFHNLPKYMDEVFRSTEGSKGKRDFMLTMMKAARAGNAYARSIIGRDLAGKPATDAAHKFVTWRDLDGNKRYTEIKDAVVRDALKGVTSPTALQLAHGTASALTRFYESGAVGPLSVAAGTVFAPKSALYAATIGTALSRPKGVAIGAIDRLTQNLTGGATGFRGIDGLTTMPIHMALRAATNVGTVLVERGARILHNSVLDSKGILSLVDPATRQAAADAMHSWYRKTAMYDMQRQGLMSPGSFMSVDPSLKYSDPTRALTRGTGITVGGVHVPGSKITGEVGSFVNDILHAISSSPAMAIMDVNKNVPKWKVASAIRNLSGDPGASGAFRNRTGVIGAAGVQATPWGNIYIQSMTRLASSLKNDPGGTLAGITAGIGMPAMMATIWNNDAGPEYSRYQYLERTPDKQASSIYIAIPGRNPNDGIEMDVDPLMRPFKLIAEGLTGLASGAFTGEMFKPGNEEQRLAFKEMIHHRMGSLGPGGVLRSLFEQTVLPPVPGFVQAGAAATGIQLRSYVDARATHARPQQGFASGTEPGVNVSLGMAEDIMRGIGASFGGAVVDFIRGIQRDTNPRAAEFGNVTKPLIGGESSALGTQFKEWKQRISDSTAELGSGPLFNTFRAIVPSQEASSQAVKVKIDNIKTISEQMQLTTNRAGVRLDLGNKKIGTQERIGAHPAQPGQVEGEVAQATQELYKMLQPTLQQIKVHYQQSEDVKASNQFTPAMKRALREEEAYKIIDLNRRMLQDVQRVERVLSQQYRTKIDFSNLKLQGGQ